MLTGKGKPLHMGIQFNKGETLQPISNQDASNKQPTVTTTTAGSPNVTKPLMSLVPKPSASYPSSQASPIRNVATLGMGGHTSGGSGSLGVGQQPKCSSEGFKVCKAQQFLSLQEYQKLFKEETDPQLKKLRKLAIEVISLKTDRPNAVDKMMSACNRVPVRIEFKAEHHAGGNNGSGTFTGFVLIEGVEIGSGEGFKLKDSKVNAYEVALQTIFMPFLRVVKLDQMTKQLESSKTKFTSEPPEPSKNPVAKPKVGTPVTSGLSKSKGPKDYITSAGYSRESNADAIHIKRQANEFKRIEDFVIVEPKIPVPDCTPAHTLRRSADFNRMLLEMEFMATGSSVKCTLRLENTLLADVSAGTKPIARNLASNQSLEILRRVCWVIKTKQACDSETILSKEDMFAELNESSDVIKSDNVGHKMLQRMGWSGGGVGKDGSGIAQPVEVTSVLNRQGLGLSAATGVTDEFRRKMHDKIVEFASSDRQDDLVFSNDFTHEERQIIHDECRKMNLKSKSRGKGKERFLCARRKRSAFELFDHIMASGGETVRYALCPPGCDDEMGMLDSQGQSILQALQQGGSRGEVRDPSGGTWGRPPGAGGARQNYGNGQQRQNRGNFTHKNNQQNFRNHQQNYGSVQNHADPYRYKIQFGRGGFDSGFSGQNQGYGRNASMNPGWGGYGGQNVQDFGNRGIYGQNSGRYNGSGHRGMFGSGEPFPKRGRF